MSKEVGEMVRSRDVVQAEGSARTEGARRATGVPADGAAADEAGSLAPVRRGPAPLAIVDGSSLSMAAIRHTRLNLARSPFHGECRHRKVHAFGASDPGRDPSRPHDG